MNLIFSILLLVVIGALIGVIALRLTSGLFIRWLSVYTNLEIAGYIAIGLVGSKLLYQLIDPMTNVPEWLIFIIITILFVWGLSNKEIELET